MTKKIPVASIIVLSTLVTLSGCAGRLARQNQETAQEQAQQQTSNQAVNARLDDLQAKLAAMNDKLNATRQALDNFLAAHEPKGTGVPEQAVDTVGIPVSAAPLAGAGAGFVDDDAVHQYRKAAILLETQRYSDAITAFSAFLGNYPDNPLAGSAQYHIGEAYFRQKQYAKAEQEFQKVLTSYDRSPHVSDTLRLMAATEDSLGKNEAAARHRQLLTSLFAASPAAAQVAQDRTQGARTVQVQQVRQQQTQPQDDSGIPANPVTQLAKPGLDGPPPTANMNQ